MAGDPYEILGVARDATPDDIRKAYRRQAKKLHPDLNPGDKLAEHKFKELNTANDILGDAEKRGRYDRGEIDGAGDEKPQQRYYRDYAGAGADGGHNPYTNTSGFSDFEASDIFSDLFGGGRGSGTGGFKAAGGDALYRLEVGFLEALNGAKRQVSFGPGTVLDITIPAGTRDGQVLRLKGKGQPGIGGGPAGDALIEISVMPHKFFVRDGDDIRLELPISIAEAVKGGKIRVPTPTGSVLATVPPWSSSGKVLRLKGRGASRRGGEKGDLYVTLTIVLPAVPDPALEKFVADWPQGTAQNPRKAMES